MMSDCCNDSCASRQPVVDMRYRRVLTVALLVNLSMFLVEVIAGSSAGSSALLADSLDFLGDAANYGISLFVLGYAAVWRTRAALLKGATMGIFGLWVLSSTLERLLAGQVPEASTMGLVSFLALLSNVGVAYLLFHYRTGDSNMRSVWICSRNDAIGNVTVMCAAAGVWFTSSSWPDVVVALGMALLTLSGAIQIIRTALGELGEAEDRDEH